MVKRGIQLKKMVKHGLQLKNMVKKILTVNIVYC